MIIVILNACESLSSNEFMTILSKKGLEKADKISTFLADEINPDIIYSSPFVRALQTIYPFCYQNKKYINAECCLYPLNRYDRPNIYYHDTNLSSLPNYFQYLRQMLNTDYSTTVFHSNVSRKETDRHVGNRVFPFLYALKNKYQDTNKTILIISHSDIFSYILKFFKIKVNSSDHGIHVINITSSHQTHKHIAMSMF